MAGKNVKTGVWNHTFMPSGGEDVYCIWETKAGTSGEDFQKLVDGPDGPSKGTFVNKVGKVVPGASNPVSFFAKGPAGNPTASSGAFFWVHHEFQEAAAEAFFKIWEDWSTVTLHEANNKLGFHNRTFQPMSATGPCYCIWEAEKDMLIEDIQKFIDGPAGPSAGKIFKNVVHKAAQGTLPSAHFKKA